MDTENIAELSFPQRMANASEADRAAPLADLIPLPELVAAIVRRFDVRDSFALRSVCTELAGALSAVPVYQFLSGAAPAIAAPDGLSIADKRALKLAVDPPPHVSARSLYLHRLGSYLDDGVPADEAMKRCPLSIHRQTALQHFFPNVDTAMLGSAASGAPDAVRMASPLLALVQPTGAPVHMEKRPGEPWTNEALQALLDEFETLRAAGWKAAAAQNELAKKWGYTPDSIRIFLTRARANRPRQAGTLIKLS